MDVGDITGSETQWNLGVGDKVLFSFNGFEHSIRVIKVGPNYAIFQVASAVQEFTLNISQTKDVDLTEDGKADISLNLMDIIYSKALVKVTSLVTKREQIVLLPPAKSVKKAEPAPAQEQASVPAPEAAAPAAEQPPAQAPAPEAAPVAPAVKQGWWVSNTNYVYGGLFIVLCVGALIAFLVRKPKNRSI